MNIADVDAAVHRTSAYTPEAPGGGISPASPRVLLDVRQAREADRAAVADGTPARELMQNAGAAVASVIAKRWSTRPVTVLCGPGGNGGDGFVAATLLATQGWTVRVALLGTRAVMTGASREHADRWQGPVEPLGPGALDGAELVIDGIFGSGLNHALDGAVEQTLAAVALRHIPMVAIDVPTGVLGDTGESRGAVTAALTVTYFRKKPGHLLLPGRDLCGEVVVADIGIPSSVLDDIGAKAFENGPALWADALPHALPAGNKYGRGHALIAGGYPMTGASRMAARAAARIGAGLTTIAVPVVALPIYASSLTSIMVVPIKTLADFLPLLDDARMSGFLIGPGAEVSADTRELCLAMLATRRPVLLDADALTVFHDNPSELERAILGPCVMTPHEGEFRRIFDLAGDKLSRTRAAAFRSGAVVVLKGSDTVVAAPDGRAVINANAPASLATAGSGDVLSGIVLGLLAQGMDCFLAAAAAVWLHGAAAVRFGPGLLAEDLPDLLPAVLRDLLGEQHARDGA